MVTIKSTFDDEGRFGSKKCSGFRVGFNQEIGFKPFRLSMASRTVDFSLGSSTLAWCPKFNKRLLQSENVVKVRYLYKMASRISKFQATMLHYVQSTLVTLTQTLKAGTRKPKSPMNFVRLQFQERNLFRIRF